MLCGQQEINDTRDHVNGMINVIHHFSFHFFFILLEKCSVVFL